jgi:hypothetical protein
MSYNCLMLASFFLALHHHLLTGAVILKLPHFLRIWSTSQPHTEESFKHTHLSLGRYNRLPIHEPSPPLLRRRATTGQNETRDSVQVFQGLRGACASGGLDSDHDTRSRERATHRGTEVCVAVGGHDDVLGYTGWRGDVVQGVDGFAVGCAIFQSVDGYTGLGYGCGMNELRICSRNAVTSMDSMLG